MLPMTTTLDFEGYKVTAYHGVVIGISANGVNVVRDIFAKIRDFVGGRVNSIETVSRDTHAQALTELSNAATAAGANALIGISIDRESTREGAIVYSISGTAVTIIAKEGP